MGFGPPRSLRRRVALLTGGALALTVMVLTLVLGVGTRRALLAEVDRQLLDESTVVEGLVGRAGGRDVRRFLDPARGGRQGRGAQRIGPRGRTALDVLGGVRDELGGATGVAQVIDASGEPLFRDTADVVLPVDEVDRDVAAGGAGVRRLRTVDVDERPVRLMTAGLVDGLAVQVALPLGDVQAGQARLLRTVLVVGAGGSLLGAWPGWWWLGASSARSPSCRPVPRGSRRPVTSTRTWRSAATPSSPGWPRPSTTCSTASPPRAGPSASSWRTPRTSCGRR